MNRRTILFAAGLIMVLAAMAQNRRIAFNAEVGYLYGLMERMDGYTIRQSDVHINARSFRAYAFYPIHYKWQVGIGAGLSRYTGTGDNVAEILIAMRYKPLKSLPNAFVTVTGGTHVGGGDFTSGFVTGIAVGYIWKLSTSTGIYGLAGYDWTHFKRETWNERINSNRHSLSVRLGFMF